MSRARCVDLATLCTTVPDAVISSGELRATGVPNSTVATRCRPTGPWQRVLPGVLLLSSGHPTPGQRVRAAATYVGGDCVITGVEALRRHGAELGPRPAHGGEVHVLVSARRRRASREYVLVERTTRLPEPVWHDGLAWAPAARAAVDAARRQRDPAMLRALLVAPVRAGACTLAQVRAELDAGSQRGTAAPRAVLDSIALGARRATSALARRVVAGAPLPPPRWHVPLRAESGAALGVADAWWDDVALAWDFGGSPPSRPTVGAGRRGALAAGAMVLRTPPARLRDDPVGVVRELVAAFLHAASRPRPSVRAG